MSRRERDLAPAQAASLQRAEQRWLEQCAARLRRASLTAGGPAGRRTGTGTEVAR